MTSHEPQQPLRQNADAAQPGTTPAVPQPPERLSVGAESAARPSNPYVGPRAFRTGEPLYGRTREIDDLFDLLVARRIVLLYAPSGAGKSSLVQAGLIPRLRADGFADLPVVRVNLAPEAGTPNRYLASVVASLQAGTAAATVATTSQLPGATAEERAPRAAERSDTLDAVLDEWETSRSGSPVLILDQFEEIFSVDPTDLEAKRAFFAALGGVLQRPNRWALIVMREEFIGALEPYARYIPTRLAATMRLDLLGVDAARDAIQKPAATVIEGAAVEALIDDLRVVRVQQPDGSVQHREGAYVEPSQLQVVCYRLWEQPRANRDRITAADVAAAASAAGAVDAALAGYYADQVAAVATRFVVSERRIRAWFDRHLITPQGVRAQVLREPDGTAEDGRIPDAVIRALVDAHLVRAEERRGVTWYELAHDRLIEPVRQSNRVWADTHLHALQRGADVWNQQARHDGFLLSDEALDDAERWAAAHAQELTAIDREYLRESRQVADALIARREREQQEYELDAARRVAESERAARKRQTALSLALAVLALLALAAFAFSLWQTAEANLHRDLAREAEAKAAEERDTAQKASTVAAVQSDAARKASIEAQAQSRLAAARELAVNASLQLNDDPQLSTLLALESLKLAYTPEADSVAWQGANQSYLRLTFDPGAPVDRALYSLDGKRLLTFGRQLAVQGRVADPVVWDAESGKQLSRLSGHKLEITDAAWSPDGRRIATASADNTAIIWDASNGRQLALLGGARADVTRIAWSRDGRRIAAAHRPGFVRISDATSGETLRELTQPGEVLDLAWGPGDRLLATVGTDQLLHLWDTESGRSARALSGHTDAIRVVAWNAAGSLIATGGNDGSARIWDLELQRPQAVLAAHSGAVTSLAWHPKDNVLVTGDKNGAGRIWRALSGELLRDLSGHWGAVHAIAFAPSGDRLATAAEDATARVWDYGTGIELFNLRGHHGGITSVMFSPDGRRLLTGSSTDRTARIWDVAQPAWANIPLGRSLASVAWSADGVHVAVAGGETALLWNATTNINEGELDHAFPVAAVAFSPDGKLLATGSGVCCDISQGDVTVWNVSTREEQWTRSEHASVVESVAWSPDGRRIASGSADETVRIWDTATGKESLLIKAGESLRAIAWSRDGRYLAGALHSVVRLWDAQSGQLVREFAGIDPATRQIAFSPDSRLLLVPAEGRAARVYEVASGAMRFEARMNDSVNAAAWSPDGLQFATGGADGVIRLSDAASGAARRDLLGPNLGVLSLAFNPDGRRLATVHNDETLRFFMSNLDEMIAYAKGRAARELTCAERVRYLHEQLTCP